MLDLATKLDIRPIMLDSYRVETKASDIIISDIRDAAKFKRYVREEKPRIAKQVKSLWKDLGGAVDPDMAKSIIAEGGVPQELNDLWREMIIDFVREDLAKEWIRNITKAGEIIERKVNRIKVKQFDFSDAVINVKTWIDTQGGKLIVDLTQAQYKSAQAMIQQQVTWGVTSPALMAERILPTIGLTNRESLAVVKFMAGLTDEGVSGKLLNEQVKRYARFLHNNRAFRIARTEISNSYNFGQMDSVRQAMEAGYLPGEPEKSWIAGGIDPCEICTMNEADGNISLNQAFSSGDEHPTAHPQCLLGETPVLVPGATKGFISSYNGPLIRVVFSGGDVTITPNHLFLTPEGFARASSLRKGDKVLYSLTFEREILGHPNNNGKPPLIKQIVTSLTESGSMTAFRVPVSPEYFHGDGSFMDGDIDIIAPNGFLESNRKAIFSKFITKNYLAFLNSNLFPFVGDSNLASMLFRLRDTADGGIGSRCESLFFSKRKPIHDKFSDFTRGPLSNSSLGKPSCDDGPAYSKALSNLIFRFSSEISLRDVLDIQVIFPHRTLPVYDVETSSSLYIANGLVSSNCECSVGYSIRRN